MYKTHIVDTPLRVRENSDSDLEYRINALKKKLIKTIQAANNNLLDPRVLKVSRELDELIFELICSSKNDEA